MKSNWILRFVGIVLRFGLEFDFGRFLDDSLNGYVNKVVE